MDHTDAESPIELPIDFDRIPPDRRATLDLLAGEVTHAIDTRGTARLVFVCTHNSRRSQFAQIWAAYVGHRLDLPIECHSAGTEVTSVAPGVLDAIANQGMSVDSKGGEPNSIVEFRSDAEGFGIRCFSKRLDDASIPPADVIAIMVCDAADHACPTVRGARSRTSLPYDDPKRADGTDDEASTYRASARRIANEMHYLLRKVADR